MAKIHVDIFSDPVCPWCLVGLARLDAAMDRARERLGGALEFSIVHHPFLLDAATPEEGEDVAEMLRRKYGAPPDAMWDRLEVEAGSVGIDLDMRKQKRRVPSQKALVLIVAAGKKGTQHALARDVSAACYLEARDISDVDVLVELGARHGFEAEEVRQLLEDGERIRDVEKQAAQAREAGIRGVPFFVLDDMLSLSGAQPDDVFDKALDRALSMQKPPG